MGKTLYEILGVSNKASESEIKKSFRKLSLVYHSDRWPKRNDVGYDSWIEVVKSEEQAKISWNQINDAYEILSDAQKRREYDDKLRLVGDNIELGSLFSGIKDSFSDDIWSGFQG